MDFALDRIDRIVFHEQAHKGDDRHRRERGKNHDAEKLAGRYRKSVVKVEVLRVAEWRQHPAEVRRHGLERERVRHFVLFPGGVQHAVPQRQEREQRHVVCDQHRCDVGYRNQRGDQRARRAKELYQFVGKRAKNVLTFQRGNDRGHAEQ